MQASGGQALRLIGTADADQFAEATLFLGPRAEPERWLKVKKRITAPVHGDTLMVLPAGVFVSAKQWTLRLVVRHEDGSTRQSTFALTLG